LVRPKWKLNERPLPSIRDHIPLAFEDAQRLAHGIPLDVEVLAQEAFRHQALAWADIAVKNLLLESLSDLLVLKL
jgi:hypothetical protein